MAQRRHVRSEAPAPQLWCNESLDAVLPPVELDLRRLGLTTTRGARAQRRATCACQHADDDELSSGTPQTAGPVYRIRNRSGNLGPTAMADSSDDDIPLSALLSKSAAQAKADAKATGTGGKRGRRGSIAEAAAQAAEAAERAAAMAKAVVGARRVCWQRGPISPRSAPDLPPGACGHRRRLVAFAACFRITCTGHALQIHALFSEFVSSMSAVRRPS